ncbi:DUF4176 domain-containing protein [Terribacillus sp. DMT04]|nr:DUF4176 domain-containing protein [Terribacillus sp. DMT04]
MTTIHLILISTLLLTGCSFEVSSGSDNTTEPTETTENINTDKLIPIGSVVKLKKAEKPVMIHGYEQQEVGTEELYDYISVPYPEGHIRPDYSIFFNREDIEEVLHVGYSTPEDKELREEADSRLKD